MTLVNITAQDGSPVEFEYIDPVPTDMKGGQKEVYWNPQRQYVVAFYHEKKVKFTPNDRVRLETIVGKYYTDIFNNIGGEYWKKVFCWPRKIVEWNGKTGFVEPAYDPCYTKETNSFLVPEKFNKLPQEEKGDLIQFMRICLRLARGVRRLHAAGLSHSDLSPNNCRIDPKGGNACIIDCDSLVVPELFPPAGIIGTPGFIAPEVLMQKGKPCRVTDEHALAVLIYSCLFHRHPLKGDGDDTYDKGGELTAQAVFIEHPTNASNRYHVNSEKRSIHERDPKRVPWIDTAKLPCSVLGLEMKGLFEKTFVAGLHDPAKRPSANDWEDALVAAMEMVLPCQNNTCVKKWFVFNDSAKKQKCPYCGTPFNGIIPVIDFYTADRNQPLNKRLTVIHNLPLYPWHSSDLSPNEKLSEVQKNNEVSKFRFENGKWILQNLGLPHMKDITNDKDISVRKRVKLTDGLQLLLQPGARGRIAKVRFVN